MMCSQCSQSVRNNPARGIDSGMSDQLAMSMMNTTLMSSGIYVPHECSGSGSCEILRDTDAAVCTDAIDLTSTDIEIHADPTNYAMTSALSSNDYHSVVDQLDKHVYGASLGRHALQHHCVRAGHHHNANDHNPKYLGLDMSDDNDNANDHMPPDTLGDHQHYGIQMGQIYNGLPSAYMFQISRHYALMAWDRYLHDCLGPVCYGHKPWCYPPTRTLGYDCRMENSFHLCNPFLWLQSWQIQALQEMGPAYVAHCMMAFNWLQNKYSQCLRLLAYHRHLHNKKRHHLEHRRDSLRRPADPAVNVGTTSKTPCFRLVNGKCGPRPPKGVSDTHLI